MTIQLEWSCKNDIWNFLQKPQYKPVSTSLELQDQYVYHVNVQVYQINDEV
jgi:hypothetical protein